MKKILKQWFKFCCEHPSNIEGYDRWLNDKTDTEYHCHHRLEIELGKSKQELIEENMYYGRPASELIIMTESEHTILHNTGKHHTEETKRKIGEAKKGKQYRLGKHHSDETRKKMSEAKKGNQNNLGKRWWNNGVINKRSKTCPGPDFVPGQLRHK